MDTLRILIIAKLSIRKSGFSSVLIIIISWSPEFLLSYHLFKVAENRMQQRFAAHTLHSCQQYCSALLRLNQPQSGLTMLNNIVDNYEQCGQHNIVASCFYQP